MELNFVKYQGAGNDFVLLDGRGDGAVALTVAQISALCCRRTGVGADGLMILMDSSQNGVDFHMQFYNSDGLPGTMCGNGGRCIARFADDLGIGGPTKIFSAPDGLHTAQVLDCGDIRLTMSDVGRVNVVEEGWMLDTGSPHLVLRGPWDAATARTLRQKYNANVNFVITESPAIATIQTYERGVEDMTWACGTGAVATAVALHSATAGNPSNSWEIASPGGTLMVSFEPQNDGSYKNVTLSGPAQRVFCGIYNIE